MEWFFDIFYAVVIAGLPIMALTFAVIWWAISRGRLEGNSVGELQQSIKALGKRQEKKANAEVETQMAAGMESSKLSLGDLGMGKLGQDGLVGKTNGESNGKGDGKADAQKQTAKADEDGTEKLDPVLEKWFSFGGGFYGIVALYTLVVIEWDEVWGFLTALPDLLFSFDIGGLISLAISLFIESIMNFFTAIAWPLYWLNVAGNPWIWGAVAYAGYWLGIKVAQQVADRSLQHTAVDLNGAITRPEEEEG